MRRWEWIVTPYPYLLLFLFSVLSSFHLMSRFLISIGFEFILFSAILVSSVLWYVKWGFGKDDEAVVLVCAIILFLIASPILSSISNQSYFDVLSSWEYKSWTKALLLSPVFYLAFSLRNKILLQWGLVLSGVMLSFIFWYRFGILAEVREFDQRPDLHLKNGDPNFLCALFGTLLPLTVCLYRVSSPKLLKAFFLFSGVCFSSVVFFSESRMGILAVILGGGYLLLKKQITRWKMAVSFVLISMVVLFSKDSLRTRFFQFQDTSNQMRYESLKVGLSLFSKAPVWGVGWDKSKDYFFQYSNYPRLISEGKPLEVHNTFLQVLAELGIFGFLAYASFLFFCFHQILKSKSPFRPYLGVSFFILTLNLLTLPLQNKDFVILLNICLASLAASPRCFTPHTYPGSSLKKI